MLLNRFSIVPVLSSAARIPFPGATSFLATDSKFSVFIVFSQGSQQNDHLLPCKMIGEMQPKIGARGAMNAFLDARSNLCYTHINVEQDHHFAGDGCCAFHGSGGCRREVVHPFQRAKSKSLSTKLLR